MPFALVFIGILLIVTGARGTYAQLGTMIAGEFTGPVFPSKGQPQTNFITFALAILILGSLGYVEKFRTISHLMLFLVLAGVIVSNKGFFANFQKALQNGPTQPNAVASSSSSSSPASIAGAAASSAGSAASSGASSLPGFSGSLKGDIDAFTGFLLNPEGNTNAPSTGQ